MNPYIIFKNENVFKSSSFCNSIWAYICVYFYTIHFPFCRIDGAKWIEINRIHFICFLQKKTTSFPLKQHFFVALKFVCSSSFTHCDRPIEPFLLYLGVNLFRKWIHKNSELLDSTSCVLFRTNFFWEYKHNHSNGIWWKFPTSATSRGHETSKTPILIKFYISRSRSSRSIII